MRSTNVLYKYKLFGALMLVGGILFVVAACGGGNEAGTTEAAAPTTEAAPPATTEAAPADTGAADTGAAAEGTCPTVGGLVDCVEVTGIGTVYADPTKNDPAVLGKVIAPENPDWAFPVQFTDCNAADTEKEGCNPGTETPGVYTPLPTDQITQTWNICVSFPHLKDAYWVASNYGAWAESVSATGEVASSSRPAATRLTKQLSQLDNCVAQGAQAVVIGGISYDGLNAKLQEFIDNDVKVVDLINGMSNPNIQAHSLITYYKMGKRPASISAASTSPASRSAGSPALRALAGSRRRTQGFKDAIAAAAPTIVEIAERTATPARTSSSAWSRTRWRPTPTSTTSRGPQSTAEAAVAALDGARAHRTRSRCSPTTDPDHVRVHQERQDLVRADRPEPDAISHRNRPGCPPARGATPRQRVHGQERVEPYAELVCGPGAGDANNLDDFVDLATFAPHDFKPTFTAG